MGDNVLSKLLHQRFFDCPQFARLLSSTKLSTEISGTQGLQQELHVTGLVDPARSLVLAFLHHEVARPFFLVVADNHSAFRYRQEISNLSTYPVFLYPASEVSPYEQVLHSPDTIAGQMEVLQHILKAPSKPYIVIMPAKALLQRVLDKETLAANTLRVAVKNSLDLLPFTCQLVALGYKRENIVTLRGEFSVRGDIIDIFPSAGLPVRIELLGDEVESIRTFNIDTQRSIDQIDLVQIPPRWWVVLHENASLGEKLQAAVEAALNALDNGAKETLRCVMENDALGLTRQAYIESSEYYTPFQDEAFTTICHYIPQDALLIFDEWDSTAMSLRAYEQKLMATYEEGVSSGRLLPLPRLLHLSLEEMTAESKLRQRIFFSHLPAAEASMETTGVVNFNSSNVERFNNQITQIVEKIRTWIKEGHQVLVSSEHPQRVLGLLREWQFPAVYLSEVREAVLAQNLPGASLQAELSLYELTLGNAGLNPVNYNSKLQEVDNPSTVWVTREGFTSGFCLQDISLSSLTDAELFGLKRKPVVYHRSVVEKTYERFTAVSELKMGDYVVHVKHGIGQFVGVQRISYDNQTREYLTVQYAGEDRLYVPVDQINLLTRYRGAGEHIPRLCRLGGSEWESTKRKVRRSVKQKAEDLLNLYAIRSKQEGFTFLPDTPWQYEMEEAFPYEETPDQWQAILDTKVDMEAAKPMDRLICGDVGFGKTEVAIRGIFKTIMSGKQAAILVPTTILAQQHFNTISERFAAYPVRVGLLSRFRTAKEQKEIIRRLVCGECDVVVGTHRLLQKDIAFKDLGLVVIDEEHRFGVVHKEKLKQLRVMVDVLTMSATPIPRTLYLALSGTRDMSLINTPPVNRAPIKTYVGEYRSQVVRTALLHELERSGQVYFVHNRIETIEGVAASIKDLVPEARIAIGHGQMQERDLENVMLAFANCEFDILVCTTIIESGLDIPNVNTIIIDAADKLGLAQLYQLRGRVGRSDVQAYAYCFFRPEKVISETAQNRLKAIREFTSLGSGYQIALRDMEIRGVGNILGAEQHGHMVAVGFDLYCKLLEEAILELKGEQIIPEPDTQIDINITAFIPDSYIADPEHRIIEYKRIADVRSERELTLLVEEWKDRFGPVPQEVQQLVQIVRLRLLASKVGIVAIKPEAMGIRLMVNWRLQRWLPIQAKLPKSLASRTAYKPGSPGAVGPMPYILVRCENQNSQEQLTLLEELLSAMLA